MNLTRTVVTAALLVGCEGAATSVPADAAIDTVALPDGARADTGFDAGREPPTFDPIPVDVFEVAGAAGSDPSYAVVPLRRGIFFHLDGFALTREDGTPVPAQFEVVRRWSAIDDSIREVGIDFQIALEANENVRLLLRPGINPEPESPVRLERDGDDVRIENGRLDVRIAKAFNFLDSVRIDGEVVLDAEDNDGGYLINRFGERLEDAEGCTALSPTVLEVEKEGPVHVRVRVERPAHIVRDTEDPCFALFPEAGDPVPGFAVWFDVYAGDPRVRIHRLELNNGITAFREGRPGDGLHGWPLYYEESGVQLRHVLTSPDVILGGDTSEEIARAPFRAIQESAERFVRPASEERACSYADVSQDGLGFLVVDPYCRETYPNGFAAEGSTFTILNAPDGCEGCAGMVDPTTPSTSGLYLLGDMAASETIVDLVFHSESFTPEARRDAFLRRRLRPVAVTTPEVYRETAATTDLFGILSDVAETEHTPTLAIRGPEHMQNWGVRERYTSCETGGIATAAMGHLVQRPPNLNEDELFVLDEIRRKQYVPSYWSGVSEVTPFSSMGMGPDIATAAQVTGHTAAEFSTSGYCTPHAIRAFQGNGRNAKYIPGKTLVGDYEVGSTASPRDNPHLWIQRLYDVPTDNPITLHFRRRYAQYLVGYVLQLEARIARERDGVQPMGFESMSAHWPQVANRALGHSLIALSDAYADTGEDDLLDAMTRMVHLIARRQSDQGAIINALDDPEAISFQDGYLMNGVLNAMMLVPREHAIYRTGWAVLMGGAGREGKPGLIDAMIGANFGYYAEVGCTPEECPMSRTHVTAADSLAVAAYLLASEADPFDDSRRTEDAELYMGALAELLASGLSGIGPAYEEHRWQGEGYGRTTGLVAQWRDLPASEWGRLLPEAARR
ncbi:MAG: hypothetical protein AAGE52_36375 [Myxococcota bacterium]